MLAVLRASELDLLIVALQESGVCSGSALSGPSETGRRFPERRYPKRCPGSRARMVSAKRAGCLDLSGVDLEQCGMVSGIGVDAVELGVGHERHRGKPRDGRLVTRLGRTHDPIVEPVESFPRAHVADVRRRLVRPAAVRSQRLRLGRSTLRVPSHHDQKQGEQPRPAPRRRSARACGRARSPGLRPHRLAGRIPSRTVHPGPTSAPHPAQAAPSRGEPQWEQNFPDPAAPQAGQGVAVALTGDRVREEAGIDEKKSGRISSLSSEDHRIISTIMKIS